MNHVLLNRDGESQKASEAHYERLKELAARADENRGTDVSDMSMAEFISLARRA